MSRTYSPLRYPGGKSQFLPNVIKIIDDNNLHGCTYIEPFAGGAGVAIGLLLQDKVSKIILNDNDPAIFAFWKNVVVHCNKFCAKIEKTKVTIDEWRTQKYILDHQKAYSSFEIGFAAFFLNRTNRSGILFANPIGGINQTNGDYDITCRFNKEKLIKKIKAIHERRNQIVLSKVDARTFIRKYKNEPNAFWFIDPPYYAKGEVLYHNAYKQVDHRNLSKVIIFELENAKWILTYDISKYIKKLYKNIDSELISLNYSVEIKKKSKEYLFFKNIILEVR